MTFVLRFGTIGAAEQDLTNLQIIARNPQKRLDIVYLLLYNRRKHFLSSSNYYLLAQEKKTMTKFAQMVTDFRGTRKKVVDLLLRRGGADYLFHVEHMAHRMMSQPMPDNKSKSAITE